MCPLRPEILLIRFWLWQNWLRRCKNWVIRSRNRPNIPINRSEMCSRIVRLIGFSIYWFSAKFARKSLRRLSVKPVEFWYFRFSVFLRRLRCVSADFSRFSPIFSEFFKNRRNQWGLVFLLSPNFWTLVMTTLDATRESETNPNQVEPNHGTSQPTSPTDFFCFFIF
jgi:hypothetical protein